MCSVFRECYKALCQTTDAEGRKLKVHKIPAAAPFAFTAEEAYNLLAMQGVGKEGDLCVPGYANFLITKSPIRKTSLP